MSIGLTSLSPVFSPLFNQPTSKGITMKRIYIKAFNQLKKLGCPVFERSDVDGFIISAEHPESWQWADMYTSRSTLGRSGNKPRAGKNPRGQPLVLRVGKRLMFDCPPSLTDEP
jgi:hypothetical protein